MGWCGGCAVKLEKESAIIKYLNNKIKIIKNIYLASVSPGEALLESPLFSLSPSTNL